MVTPEHTVTITPDVSDAVKTTVRVSTLSCTKSRDLPAVCALCQGNHPANYRGCQVFKNLQQLRKQPPSKTNPNTIEKNANYNDIPLLNQPGNSTSFSNNKINNKSYSQATKSNKNSSHTINEHQNQQNYCITSQLSSFLNEFKTLISPLISLLTTVIEKLIYKND